MTYKVFVSHSTTDRDWVEWIKGQTGPGVELWLAEHDVRLGRHLPMKIQKELDGSDAVVVFLTESSRSAAYVQQEIGWALKAKKLVVPVVQDGISRQDLAMLEGAEYILFDFHQPEKGRTVLLNHLQKLAQAKAASEDLQTALLLIGALLVIGLVALSAAGEPE